MSVLSFLCSLGKYLVTDNLLSRECTAAEQFWCPGEFYLNGFYGDFEISKTTKDNWWAKASIRKQGAEAGTANEFHLFLNQGHALCLEIDFKGGCWICERKPLSFYKNAWLPQGRFPCFSHALCGLLLCSLHGSNNNGVKYLSMW